MTTRTRREIAMTTTKNTLTTNAPTKVTVTEDLPPKSPQTIKGGHIHRTNAAVIVYDTMLSH
jgi:hypothetical protein